MGPTPRVLVIWPDHWARALLRAELRERGYDAVGADDLAEALAAAAEAPGRGPVALVLVDHDAAAGRARWLLDALLGRAGRPPAVLLGHSTVAPPPGPWRRVIPRPFGLGELVHLVQTIVPLPRELEHRLE